MDFIVFCTAAVLGLTREDPSYLPSAQFKGLFAWLGEQTMKETTEGATYRELRPWQVHPSPAS